MKAVSQKIFCAFCRLERKAYFKKSVSWTNVALAFIGASLMMYAVWQRVDARATLFFVIFLAISEVFLRVRWRMGVTCPHCGFDPVLYKTDRELAVRRVTARLDELRASGRHLLRQNNPLVNLPKRPAPPAPPAHLAKVSADRRSLSREV